MSMSLFTRMMGIFWLFAEGLIMLFAGKGYLYIKTGETRQNGFLYFCLLVFSVMVFLSFAQEILPSRFLTSNGIFSLPFYHRYVWNLYCTLWTLIEGMIVWYVINIYVLLNNTLTYGKPEQNTWPAYGIAVFIGCIIMMYIAYHVYLNATISEGGLHYKAIRNIFVFYVKINGVFWIMIEWIIAFIAYKTFVLLKNN